MEEEDEIRAGFEAECHPCVTGIRAVIGAVIVQFIDLRNNR